jgi:hypothetical protein
MSRVKRSLFQAMESNRNTIVEFHQAELFHMVHLGDKGLPYQSQQCCRTQSFFCQIMGQIPAETVRAACAQFTDISLRRVHCKKNCEITLEMFFGNT